MAITVNNLKHDSIQIGAMRDGATITTPWGNKMKRLIYCLDGTTNKYDSAYPTNVVMLHKSVMSKDHNGVEQIAYYDTGVGTEFGELVLGMAVGLGLMKNVLQAYQHLCENYKAGDQIFIFGFSRGAYTARSLGGLVRLCGIVDADRIQQIKSVKDFYEARLLKDSDHLEKLENWRKENCTIVCADEADRLCRINSGQNKNEVPPIVKIQYIGVWDTVKTLGIKEKKYDWHDDSLSAHTVFARHAVALDERRKKFNVTEWDNIEALNKFTESNHSNDKPYKQMWFPGGHGSIGGGGPVRGLSDEAFKWILEGAEEAGLGVVTGKNAEIFKLHPNALAPLNNNTGKKPTMFGKFGNFVTGLFGNIDREGPSGIEELSHTARVRYYADQDLLPEQKQYRPKSLSKVIPLLDELPPPFDEVAYRSLAENSKKKLLGEGEQKMITVKNDRYVVYTVRKGDSLSRISKNFTGTYDNWKQIHQVNLASIPDPNLVYVGERILIPLNLVLAESET